MEKNNNNKITELETLFLASLVPHYYNKTSKTLSKYTNIFSYVTSLTFNFLTDEFFFINEWNEWSSFFKDNRDNLKDYYVFNYATPGHSTPVFFNPKEKFFIFLEHGSRYIFVTEMTHSVFKFLKLFKLTENDNTFNEYKIYFYSSGNQTNDWYCRSYTILFALNIYKRKNIINDPNKIIEMFKNENTFENIINEFYSFIKEDIIYNDEENFLKYKKLIKANGNKEDEIDVKKLLKSKFMNENSNWHIKEILFSKNIDRIILTQNDSPKKRKLEIHEKNTVSKKIEPVKILFSNNPIYFLFKMNGVWYFFDSFYLFGCNDKPIKEYGIQKDIDVLKSVKNYFKQ